MTAAHVVKGCKPQIYLSDGTLIVGTIDAIDDDFDLAILTTDKPIKAKSLEITSNSTLLIGTQVSTWGFPRGYFARSPMLSVGYIAGNDAFTSNNKTITRWVVNAAFNGGNSGGPLVDIETGEIIGVIVSKLPSLSKEALQIIDILNNKNNGFIYSGTLPDGSKKTFSEAQIVGEVLNELRTQIQLVIGYAVLTNDLRDFLKENGVEP